MEKKLAIFDLDGTLTETKSSIDREMAVLFSKLLLRKKVAVVSGGTYKQFTEQLLSNLQYSNELFKNLYLFPTCGASFYCYDIYWREIYKEELSKYEKERIIEAFSNALKDVCYVTPKKLYGKIIEDRGTQITFSALGQDAPKSLKDKWDPERKKRLEIKKSLENYISEFGVHVGGTTSIDITKKGIDKAYAIKQIEKHLGILKEEMLFVGDAIFQGGNDYPVKCLGVDCIEVFSPAETKKVIISMINND